MDDNQETESEDREMEDLCKKIDDDGGGSIEEEDIDFVIVWDEKPSDPDWSQNRLTLITEESFFLNIYLNEGESEKSS